MTSLRPVHTLRSRRAALGVALLALLAIPLLACNGGIGTDDYPYKNASMSSIDPWRFYSRYCTSFAAWRLNEMQGSTSAPWKFSNFMQNSSGQTVQWGNAYQWDDAARALGYRVDTTPAVGAIAQWGDGDNTYLYGSNNHVAIVTGVNLDGSVTVEEYNWSVRGAYDQRTNVHAPRYLHVADVQQQAAPSKYQPFSTAGSFIDRQYVDFTNVHATSSQVSSWQQAYSSGTPMDQLEANLTNRTDTASIIRLYLAYQGTVSSAGNYFTWWSRLQGGQTLASISNAFYGSPSGQAKYGKLTNAQFVTAMYQLVGRSPTASEMQTWQQRLASGMSRGAAMASFTSLAEYVNAVRTKVQSMQLYLHMLRRPPSSTTYWNQSMANITSKGLVYEAKRLRSTAEYANRF